MMTTIAGRVTKTLLLAMTLSILPTVTAEEKSILEGAQ